MFKTAFLQIMSILRNPKTYFFLTLANKPQSSPTSFMAASLKSIMTVELAAQIACQI